MGGMRALLRCESGATAIEYSFIVALIVNFVVVSLISVGALLSGTYSSVDAALSNSDGAITSSAPPHAPGK